MDAVERGLSVRLPEAGITYRAFVDMSGGSSDDATLAIAHKDANGRAVLDLVIDQGQRPPFDPRKAVARFANVLNEYHCASLWAIGMPAKLFEQTSKATALPIACRRSASRKSTKRLTLVQWWQSDLFWTAQS
jgi:hypothetical protein